MTTVRLHNKLLSLFLALVLCLSAVSLVGCGDENADDRVGEMADDFSITLQNTLPDGTYTLRYEDEKGALSCYAPICAITVANGKSAAYRGLIPENCAPVGAACIGVYGAEGNRVGSVAFADGFCRETGEKLYSFGALSDVHIGYETAEDDFANAIHHFVNNENVAFIGIAGDLTVAATDEQFVNYRDVVEAYAGNTPVYAITGNHDTYAYRGDSVLTVLEEYTGKPLYYSFTQGDDVFLMMGTFFNQEDKLFTREELQWLYESLEENKDKRIFLFQHVRPQDTPGNAHGIYDYDIWGGSEQEVFEGLLAHYPNVTLFHGHSHLKLYLQEQVKNANYDGSDGYHSVHIPSASVPRDGDETGVASREECYEESEGFVVDVYENGIRLRGYDFMAETYLPIAEYYLDTTLKAPEGVYTDDTCSVHTDGKGIAPAWQYGYLIDGETGKVYTNAKASLSKEMALEAGKTYTLCAKSKTKLSAYLYYYDATGSFLSAVTLWEDGEDAALITLTPPNGAATVRIGFAYAGSSLIQRLEECASRISLTVKEGN